VSRITNVKELEDALKEIVRISKKFAPNEPKEKIEQFLRGFVAGCEATGAVKDYGSFECFEPKIYKIMEEGL
jgi:hypothetical protein